MALVISIVGIPLVPLGALLVGGLWLVGFVGASTACGRGVLRLVGLERARPDAACFVGTLPFVTLAVVSRAAWWSGADPVGWALPVAVTGALIEGVLWTLGAGAGVLYWLRRGRPAPAAPPVPPEAPPLPVQL
jgi:hypothetical protein